MTEAVPRASLRRVCRVLDVTRASLYPPKPKPSAHGEQPGSCEKDELLAKRIEQLIHDHPTYGYRRLWALLRFKDKRQINRKTVYRILKQRGWFVTQRVATPRPRAKAMVSRAPASNLRWAMDVTHIACGRDG